MHSQLSERSRANRLSVTLLLMIVLLGLAWVVLSTYAVPHVIESAYRGHNLALFNRLIHGQAHHPVTDYLADWHEFSSRFLRAFFLLGLLVVLVLRPEFRHAVWGRTAEIALGRESERGATPESWRRIALVFAFYFALAILFTLPSSIHPTRALLGRGGDNYLHAWFLWEFARSIVHGHNPFHTDLILYPVGANLTWATTDILAQIMAVPFSLTLGPVLTYNLFVMLGLALSAFFARLLSYRVCGNAAAATVGGMIFGFSPFLLAHAWGHLSLITAFPLPLYILALARLLDRQEPSRKHGILLGLAFTLVVLANYEYALICLLFTLAILFIDFGRERLSLIKRVWLPLVISGAVSLFCFSPVLFMMLKDYGVTKPASVEQATTYSADLFSFFVPSLQQSLFGHYVRKLPAQFFVGPGGIEGIEFLGFLALILCVIGAWVARGAQRRWAGRALVAGIVFAVLSLGPTIHILGRPTTLPSPAVVLYKLSFMRFLREPARLSVVTLLCVALLASIGLTFVLNRMGPGRRRALFLCVVGTAVVLEYLACPFPSSSTVDPARYWEAPKTTVRCTLPTGIRGGSVLTIPLDDWWHFNNAMWMQIFDGGRYRLVDGRVSPYIPGPAWNNFVDASPVLAPLHRESQKTLSPAYRPPAVSTDLPPSLDSAAVLARQLDLRAVVVFNAPERPTDVEYVRRYFGGNETRIGTCAVFELPEPQNRGR